MNLAERNCARTGVAKYQLAPAKKNKASKTVERFLLCPFTLEPMQGCSTRARGVNHRCSFTLEQCTN
jgi:hypothetical protein